MSFHLSFEDRKQQFADEKVVFKNTVSVFNMVELEKEVSKKTKKIAIFDDELNAEQVIELAYRKGIDYVVQNSLQPLSEKVKILSALDKNNQEFFQEDFTFFTHSTGKHKIIFDSNTSRKTILNLSFHRLQIDIEAHRSSHLKCALEEIIMNAQIDAHNLGANKGHLKSTLILEKIDKLVAVSVIDYYGTLTYNKFTGQIESVLKIGFSNSINHNRTRGAGIGSSIIFNAADSLYLGCLPNQMTRVSAIIPFGLSETNQEKLQKSIFLL
jgi:hypothetical protein